MSIQKKFQTDYLVLGLGGLGASTLYSLSQKTKNVLGVDRFDPPHSYGSSSGETRLFRQAYFEDSRYISLLKESHQLWLELNKKSSQSLYTENGFLVVSPPNTSLLETIDSNSKEYQVPIERLCSTKIRSQYPQFNIYPDEEGFLETQAGFIQPEKTIHFFLQKSKEQGAQILKNQEVIEYEIFQDHVTLKTQDYLITTQKLIVAAGAWSQRFLSPSLFSLKTVRAPQFWFKSDESFSISRTPCFAFATDSEFIYGFPKVSDRGIKVANYAYSHKVIDPLLDNKNYLKSELSPISKCLSQSLSHVSTHPSSHHVCYFTLTEDENFLVDTHPEQPHIVFCTGGSGHAFKFVPLLGKITSDLAIGKTLTQQLNIFKFRDLGHQSRQ